MNDEQIEKLARKRVEERVGFLAHVAVYVLVNTGIIITWRLTGASYPWFIWPLVGWGAGGHEGWWRANWLPAHARGDIFGEREAAANQIYTSADRATVLGLLRQYDVRYVYVGEAERARYNGANVKLFESVLHTVYNQNGVRIFVVPGGAS